jgi:uncharacterized protein
MRFDWDEKKRRANITDHGFDFQEAALVFASATFTYQDDRLRYGEQRFVTLGLLRDAVVSIVHTETEYEIRIISFREATKREIKIYREEVGRY